LLRRFQSQFDETLKIGGRLNGRYVLLLVVLFVLSMHEFFYVDIPRSKVAFISSELWAFLDNLGLEIGFATLIIHSHSEGSNFTHLTLQSFHE
jgi:hypothetical protein